MHLLPGRDMFSTLGMPKHAILGGVFRYFFPVTTVFKSQLQLYVPSALFTRHSVIEGWSSHLTFVPSLAENLVNESVCIVGNDAQGLQRRLPKRERHSLVVGLLLRYRIQVACQNLEVNCILILTIFSICLRPLLMISRRQAQSV